MNRAFEMLLLLNLSDFDKKLEKLGNKSVNEVYNEARQGKTKFDIKNETLKDKDFFETVILYGKNLYPLSFLIAINLIINFVISMITNIYTNPTILILIVLIETSMLHKLAFEKNYLNKEAINQSTFIKAGLCLFVLFYNYDNGYYNWALKLTYLFTIIVTFLSTKLLITLKKGAIKNEVLTLILEDKRFLYYMLLTSKVTIEEIDK